MMDFTTWRESVVDIASKIADANFQRRSWFGTNSREISSPDELYNQLFDDLLFQSFLETHSMRLTEEQRVTGANLLARMNEFGSDSVSLDPIKIVDDPEWQRVRDAAAEFVSSMRQPEANKN